MSGNTTEAPEANTDLHTDTTLNSEPPEDFQIDRRYQRETSLRTARQAHPNPELSIGRERDENTRIFSDGTTRRTTDENNTVQWGGIAMAERFTGNGDYAHHKLFRVAYNTHTSMLTVDNMYYRRCHGIEQKLIARVKIDTCYVDDPQELVEALSDYCTYYSEERNCTLTHRDTDERVEILAELYKNGTATRLIELVESDVFDALA